MTKKNKQCNNRTFMDVLDHVRLIENKQTYQQMFAFISSQLGDKERDWLNQRITDCRLRYKRNDRIVWALRWLRLDFLFGFRQQLLRAEHEAVKDRVNFNQSEVLATVTHMLKKEATFFGVGDPTTVYKSPNGVSLKRNILNMESGNFNTTSIQSRFDHFLSYTNQNEENYIADIDQIVFAKQIPSDLLEQMQTIERKWQNTRNQEIQHANEHYESAEKLIEFPGGWAWWSLGVEHCSVEGKAMGHCGNTAEPRPGDRMLSLRRDVTKKGKRLQRPSLTFVLHRDGYLGEMKGRANEKPDPKYHPYIIELLKHPWVKGIEGGGYQPHKNFSIHDLPDDVRDELLTMNPELEPLEVTVERTGMTEEVLERCIQKAKAVGLPTESFTIDPDGDAPEDGLIVIQSWPTIQDFAEWLDWPKLSVAVKLREATRVEDIDALRDQFSGRPDLTERSVVEILEEMEDDAITELSRQLGVDRDTSTRLTRVVSNRKLASEILHNSYWDSVFEHATKIQELESIGEFTNRTGYDVYLQNVIRYTMLLPAREKLQTYFNPNGDDYSVVVAISVSDLLQFVNSRNNPPRYDSMRNSLEEIVEQGWFYTRYTLDTDPKRRYDSLGFSMEDYTNMVDAVIYGRSVNTNLRLIASNVAEIGGLNQKEEINDIKKRAGIT